MSHQHGTRPKMDRKAKRRAKKMMADVFIGGKKIGAVASVTCEPIKVHAGRHQIIVRTTHDVDGSPAGESCAYADQVTHVMAKDKYELANKLRELASIVSSTDSDFDTGTSHIVIGRSYSHAALKRLQG